MSPLIEFKCDSSDCANKPRRSPGRSAPRLLAMPLDLHFVAEAQEAAREQMGLTRGKHGRVGLSIRAGGHECGPLMAKAGSMGYLSSSAGFCRGLFPCALL